MKIHICTPFSLDKNLGAVYNEAFKNIPDEDFVCLIDHDVMFLTYNSIRIMYDYVEKYKDGIFTCLTNRIHPLAIDQLYLSQPSDNDSIRFWQNEATLQEDKGHFNPITEINHEISGFLMLVPKSIWNEIKFCESGKALGVDNDFSLKVLAAGKKIYRMNRIVVWHSYRLNDIKDKKHLL